MRAKITIIVTAVAVTVSMVPWLWVWKVSSEQDPISHRLSHFVSINDMK